HLLDLPGSIIAVPLPSQLPSSSFSFASSGAGVGGACWADAGAAHSAARTDPARTDTASKVRNMAAPGKTVRTRRARRPAGSRMYSHLRDTPGFPARRRCGPCAPGDDGREAPMHRIDRRTFCAGLGVSALPWPRPLSTPQEPAPSADLAALTELVRKTPRSEIVAKALALQRAGASWRDLLGAAFLAGIRDV